MTEEWHEIYEFPGYSVSNLGRVRNDFTGRIMALLRNQQGVINVGLVLDHRQHKRSVAQLVANTFLEEEDEHFDTPIHLDGDLSNNRVTNLMWRPRWFAIQYHAQFRKKNGPQFLVPIRDVNTGAVYANSREAVVTFGLLEKDLVLATLNRTFVFPTFQKFEVIDE